MIEIRDVHKTYRLGGVEVRALRGVSLEIARGEFVAVMGPSGSGKSTLMHIMGLLDRPDRGTYRLDGEDVSDLGDDDIALLRAGFVGFVFQQFNLLPRVSARENVALPLIYAPRSNGAAPEDVLKRVGLGERMNHAPGELSGGEQQRVAIARSLINNPLALMADEPTGNLDSASSRDIMRILGDLHRAGLTVIVVTHDPEVAKTAGRIVTVRDGRIVDDTGTKPDRTPDGAQQKLNPSCEGRSWSMGRSFRVTAATLRQAGRSLGANKMRTFLSMLGVLIGVAAVIAVMALGKGAKMAVEERISSMGANLLVLMPNWRQSSSVSLGAGAASRLTLSDADAVGSEIPGVKRATPVVRGTVQVVGEGRNWRTALLGVLPLYVEMHDMRPQFGRFFSETEVGNRARVAVIGRTVSEELFGDQSPLGKSIRINRIGFEVIGVLPQKGSSFHRDENDQVIVPITTAMRRLLGRDYVDAIELQTASADDLDYAELAALDLLKERHRIPGENDDVFRARNMADIQSAIASTSRTMSILLTAIGAISLVVGGIGIMNIMLVSVTERTREIGIRKAIGARGSDILAQFLVESLVVGVLGGLFGIALGWTASAAMSRYAGWRVAVTVPTVLTAFVFSALVGIVFGLWPAQKASRMDPIRALRYE